MSGSRSSLTVVYSAVQRLNREYGFALRQAFVDRDKTRQQAFLAETFARRTVSLAEPFLSGDRVRCFPSPKHLLAGEFAGSGKTVVSASKLFQNGGGQRTPGTQLRGES